MYQIVWDDQFGKHLCTYVCIYACICVSQANVLSKKNMFSSKNFFNLGMYARKSMCVFSQASAFNDTVHMRKETCKVVAFYVRVRENVFSLENVFLEKIVSLFADISIQ